MKKRKKSQIRQISVLQFVNNSVTKKTAIFTIAVSVGYKFSQTNSLPYLQGERERRGILHRGGRRSCAQGALLSQRNPP